MSGIIIIIIIIIVIIIIIMIIIIINDDNDDDHNNDNTLFMYCFFPTVKWKLKTLTITNADYFVQTIMTTFYKK